MKKIISFVLAVVLLVNVLLVCVSATEPAFTDTDGSEYYYVAASELATRGILTGYPDGSFGAEKSITRAETATVICRLIGKEGSAIINTENTYYTDVATDHWALGYINLATDDKIISGDGNGLFRPENTVKYQEAVKLVVCALGYGDSVEANASDWSAGYINMARDKGITDNLVGKKDEFLTRGDIAVLVYNAVKLMDADAERQAENAEKLSKLNSDEEPSLHYEETGQLGGFVGNFYDKKIKNGEDAKDSLELLKDYIGIDNIDSELEFVNSYESGDFVIYVMNQIYKGLLVYGHEVRVKTDKDGNAVSMISGFLDMEGVNVKPSVTKDNAISVVQNAHPEVTVLEESIELVIYADSDDEPYLAYTMNLSGETEFNNYLAVVDAQNGEIKEFHSVGESANDYEQGTGEDVNGQMRAFGIKEKGLLENVAEIANSATTKTKKYMLWDEERQIRTYPSENDPVLSMVYSHDSKDYNPKKDSDANGDGYNDYQLALTAHANVAEVFDYYRDVHKHTYVNNDKNNPVGVHVKVPEYQNENGIYLWKNAGATFDETKTTGYLLFGRSGDTFIENGVEIDINYATKIDTVAHEFSHLVFSFKAPAIVDKYEGLNGSINEAYADIMGEFAEAHINGYTDWKHGERYMVKPSKTAGSDGKIYPTKYFDTNFINPNYVFYDNGGVHHNSTVLSHAAFLMNERIPIETLEKVWYNSMDNYSGLSDFTHVRKAVVTAAKEMKLSKKELVIIEDAFTAVGIEEPVPYVTFYVVEGKSKVTPIAGATLILSQGGQIPGIDVLTLTTGADGKATANLRDIPFYPNVIVQKDKYLVRNFSYSVRSLENRLITIALYPEVAPVPLPQGLGYTENKETNTVTVNYKGAPLYSISNVITCTDLGENTESIQEPGSSFNLTVNEKEFICQLPAKVTVHRGGYPFEIMDWTPSIQTGQSMDVGFILPDSCPSVEAYEYDDDGRYMWSIAPNTTYTLEQPGYYHLSASCGEVDEDVLYCGNIKIYGQRTVEPSKYRVTENVYMYDEVFFNDLFKYGTEVPLTVQNGYYVLGDYGRYKIYPDGTNPQGATINLEPITAGEEFNAAFTAFRDTNGKNMNQPAFISYGMQTIQNNEIGVLSLHVGDVKVSANGVRIVGVETDGFVIPAGRTMAFEAGFATTVTALSPCSYEVYYGYDSERYGQLQYQGADLTSPVKLKEGQQIKIKAGSQDVKISYPRNGIHFIAYLSN